MIINNKFMLSYKGKIYYTSNEVKNKFSSFDYNQPNKNFRKIKIYIFDKEEVDTYLAKMFKRKEQKRKFDFSTVKNKKHLSIIKDYLDGNYTYEELGNKYNCTRQNIGTILTNYRIRNNK
jgi:hypothetical protein